MISIPITQAQIQLSALVAIVGDSQQRIAITRGGSPRAVLLAPEDLASLEETIAELSDPQSSEELREARTAIEHGALTPIDHISLSRGVAPDSG